MEDNQIIKIAVITSIIGLIGMLCLSGEISPKQIKINQVNQDTLDQDVTIECYVEKIRKSTNSKTYMITITDATAKSILVIFESTSFELEKNGFPINSLKNRKIRVIGTVSQYNGAYELILKDHNSIKIL